MEIDRCTKDVAAMVEDSGINMLLDAGRTGAYTARIEPGPMGVQVTYQRPGEQPEINHVSCITTEGVGWSGHYSEDILLIDNDQWQSIGILKLEGHSGWLESLRQVGHGTVTYQGELGEYSSNQRLTPSASSGTWIGPNGNIAQYWERAISSTPNGDSEVGIALEHNGRRVGGLYVKYKPAADGSIEATVTSTK